MLASIWYAAKTDLDLPASTSGLLEQPTYNTEDWTLSAICV